MHTAFSVEAPEGVAEADLGAIDALDAEADWSAREVSAVDLVGWLHAHSQARRVVFRGGWVIAGEGDGPLDFADWRLDAAVVLRDCRVDSALLFDHALLGRLEIDGCDLRGGLRLANTRMRGGLRIWRRTRIGSQDGISVEASKATIDGHLEVGADTRLEGGLRLVGASVGGQLSIRGGAQIAADPSGRSVAADRLAVSQNLFVQGTHTRLEGGLRLAGASVGGQLAIADGAQIAADPSGWSVAADGLGVTGGLFVQGTDTRLEGGLRLAGASVGGQLSIRGEAGVAKDVDLEAADVAILTVRSGHLGGVMDLSHAHLGRLDDDPRGWAQITGGWRLAGITIEALSGTLHGGGWTTKQRIDWLERDETPSRRPFTQVADLYRRAGHREQARKVSIAGEKATSGWFRRLWAGTTVGYGYQPWRAAIAALALVVVAWIPVALLGDGIFAPDNPDTEMTCPEDFPCLNRALYLTEAVVPVVDFGQRDAWRLDPNGQHATTLQIGEYLLDGLGWILALLLLGAVTGYIRQD